MRYITILNNILCVYNLNNIVYFIEYLIVYFIVNYIFQCIFQCILHCILRSYHYYYVNRYNYWNVYVIFNCFFSIPQPTMVLASILSS